jgi:hypothetical protein
MVASASDAGFDCTVETFELVSTDDGLRFRETGFRGPETTRPKSPLGPNWSQQRPNRPRQCPPIAGHSEAVRKSPGSRECVVVPCRRQARTEGRDRAGRARKHGRHHAIARQCACPHCVRCVFGLSRASGRDRGKSRWCQHSACHSPSNVLGRVGDGSNRRHRESFRHGCVNPTGVSTSFASAAHSPLRTEHMHAVDCDRAASPESHDCDRPWRPHHWSHCMGGWS